MSTSVAPEAARAGAPRAAAEGAGEQGPALPVSPYVVIGDTDAHGVTLSASIVRALLDAGVPPERIAIHNHFAPKPDTPATTARGGLIQYIKMLAAAVKASGIRPTIFIADIPTPVQAPAEYAEALAELAATAQQIIYIDTASHGFNAELPIMLAKKGVRNVQFRLGLSVPQTYLPAMLLAPSVQVYDLSVLGTVLDMDIDAVPELNELRQLAEKAEETQLPPINVETVRARMHEFVSFDNYLKFGKDWSQYQVPPFRMWGNMAVKVAVLAVTPVAELYRRAQEFARMPSVDEIKAKTETAGFVAVVAEEAPKGHIFNYSKLAQAAMSTPIIITYSVGFQPGKKVIAVTANVFERDTAPLATEAIEKTIPALYEEFRQKGWSDSQDFPRGAPGAKTLGVGELYVKEAIAKAVEALNNAYRQADKAKYAAQLTKNEILALVADEKLAATLASIIEKAVRAAAEACRQPR